MTFREFVDNCNKLLAEKPEIGGYLAISAGDDEGNDFSPVHYTPTIGEFDDGEFKTPQDAEEEILTPNAVCIN